MSPAQFHAKKEMMNNNALCPPPLKISKDSHLIKKPSSASSGSATSPSSSSSSINGVTGLTKPQQRHPVIIYTHSPKIIHTHPSDFMALVQKLTGLSRSDDDTVATPHDHHRKSEPGNDADSKILNPDHENKNKNIGLGNQDDNNESSSVVTEENCSSVGDVGQVINSCFVSPIFEPPANAYMANIPAFTPTSVEFLRSNQPFYNYNDSLFLTAGMTKGINEFCEY